MLDNTIEALAQQRDSKVAHKLARLGRGALLLARVPDLSPALGGQIVGYTIARNNMSGNLGQQMAKRFAGQKPYAWIQSINVRPEHQGHGVGTALLYAALSHFDNDQKASAYVLEENEPMQEWLKNRGFKRTTFDDLDPQIDFFEEKTVPAYLHRFESDVDISMTRSHMYLGLAGRLPEFVEVEAPQLTPAFLKDGTVEHL